MRHAEEPGCGLAIGPHGTVESWDGARAGHGQFRWSRHLPAGVSTSRTLDRIAKARPPGWVKREAIRRFGLATLTATKSFVSSASLGDGPNTIWRSAI